jgi:hypothetical protein
MGLRCRTAYAGGTAESRVPSEAGAAATPPALFRNGDDKGLADDAVDFVLLPAKERSASVAPTPQKLVHRGTQRAAWRRACRWGEAIVTNIVDLRRGVLWCSLWRLIVGRRCVSELGGRPVGGVALSGGTPGIRQ